MNPAVFSIAVAAICFKFSTKSKRFKLINGKLKLLLNQKNPDEIIVSREKAPFLKKWLDR